jgi:hypothetical protein
MALIPYSTAAKVGDRFLDLLHRLGIDPPIGSSFDDELLSLTQLVEMWKNPNLVSPARRADVLRVAGGVHDFAAKVLAVETQPEFKQFVPHLDLIGKSKVPGSIMMNQAVPSDTSRKMTELYFACLVLHISKDIELDHPVSSRGDNPDVMFAASPLDHSPDQYWALAIKAVSTKRSGQTIYERIEHGADQIDRSRADRGVVIINLRDALDHASLSDDQAPFATLADAIAALRADMDRLVGLSDQHRPLADWSKVFSGKAVSPVIFMGQTVAFLQLPSGGVVPTPVKALMPFEGHHSPEPFAVDLAFQLNHYMQTILLGLPGTANAAPS